MKTNVVVGIVVVVAVAVGAYFFMGNGFSNSQATYPVGEAPTEGDLSADSAPTGKKMAFSEFIKQGGSYKCTVNQSVGGVDTQGTTYVSDGMLRGEYKTQTQGINITTTVIVIDGYSYTWTSVAPNMVFKSKVATTGATVEDGSVGTSGSYSFDSSLIGDYDCEPWTLDATMFALPAGVAIKEV